MSIDKIQEGKDIYAAKDILKGKATGIEDMINLAKRLKDNRRFGYARKIFARARSCPDYRGLPPSRRLFLVQQQALCTYRDPDLPVDHRLDLAVEILEEIEDLSTTRNQETLGLAGAIFKRKWEAHSQRQHLERA